MKFIRHLVAVALSVAGSAALADDYALPLSPGAPGAVASSFEASVNGLFIDNYSFTPATFTGHVDVSFAALTPSVAFFVAELNGQSFSFFPESGATTFDFGADVTADMPLLLTIFGAATDPEGNFADGRYSLSFAGVAPVPEPATTALMLAGIGMLTLAVGRRRRLAARL